MITTSQSPCLSMTQVSITASVSTIVEHLYYFEMKSICMFIPATILLLDLSVSLQFEKHMRLQNFCLLLIGKVILI